jgi:hypothetical protein
MGGYMSCVKLKCSCGEVWVDECAEKNSKTETGLEYSIKCFKCGRETDYYANRQDAINDFIELKVI